MPNNRNDTELRAELLLKVDDLLVGIYTRGVLPAALATAGTEKITDFIMALIANARKDQVHDDFLCYSINLDVDESTLIELRDHQLHELEVGHPSHNPKTPEIGGDKEADDMATTLQRFEVGDYKRLMALELRGKEEYLKMRDSPPLTPESVVAFINQLSPWNLKTTGLGVLKAYVEHVTQGGPEDGIMP